MNVELFIPCFIDQLYPQTAFNTIKILEKAKIVDSQDMERVEREIAYLKRMRHKNVVQLYEVLF